MSGFEVSGPPRYSDLRSGAWSKKKKSKVNSIRRGARERSCRCTQNPNLLRPCGGMASPPSRPDASRERRLNMDDPRGGHPGISFAQDPAGKILLTGVPQDTPNYGRFKNGDVIISVDNTPVGGFTVQQVPSDHDDARYCRITMQRCLFFAALLFFFCDPRNGWNHSRPRKCVPSE